MNYRILYILSVGHSGSTLLDIMLGQFKNTFSTGELEHLTWQLYRELNGIEDEQGKCTCNKKFLDCEIWSEIFKIIIDNMRIDIDSIPILFEMKYLEDLNYFNKSIYLKIFKNLYHYNLRFKIIPSAILSKYFHEVTKHNLVLFDSISKVVKKEYIIDSSKNIIRFRELHKKLGQHIFPIVLVRNINKIVESKYIDKSDRNTWFKSWMQFYNYRMLPLLRNIDVNNFHIVSYEAFINNPQKIIYDLSNKININSSDFSEEITMKNRHLCAGNPMRYSDIIKIKKQSISKDEYIDDIKKSGLDHFYYDYLFNQITDGS